MYLLPQYPFYFLLNIKYAKGIISMGEHRIRNTIDPAFVCVTCLLLTADFFSSRTAYFLHPNPLDLPTQQGWIRTTVACGIGGAEEGGRGTGCLNIIYHSSRCQSPPHWYDDATVRRRRGALPPPSIAPNRLFSCPSEIIDYYALGWIT